MTTTALERPSGVHHLADPPDGHSAPGFVSPGFASPEQGSTGQGSPAQPAAVIVDVESLVTGRQLKHAIYDKGNLLLLAQGSIVTPRFKHLLVSRGIQDVMLSQADVDGMALPYEPSSSGCLPATAQLDSALAKKLDALVDSGHLFKETAGAKLKDRLVLQGCKAYSVEQRDALLAQHAQTCADMDDMIKSAAHGQPMCGTEIAGVVASYLTNLTSDADCVLNVARQAGNFAALAEHCLQMSLFGMALAIELRMGETDVRNVGLAGLLHDWGMSQIAPELLDANRILSKAEFLEIKKHPGYTLDLLKNIPTIPDSVPLICFQVHERPNGTGYPRGRKRSSIHPGARILSVADTYLALTSARPFRKPLMPYAAVECLLRQAKENLVDVDVVRALLQIVSLFPIGSRVVLSDGSTARVLRRNGNNYSSPIVQIIQDEDGELTDPLDETQIIDPAARKLTIVKAIPVTDGEQIALDSRIANISRA